MNLVIGASGIVGSHVLLELLQSNEPVVATKQKNSDLSKVKTLFSYYGAETQDLFEKIVWIDLDIRDLFAVEEALEGITHVYHCAGLVSFDSKDAKRLKEINELGTKNVVDACLFKEVRSLCYVSSIATINNSDYIHPLNEDVFWKTKGNESDYALSKYNAEREVWRAMEEGLNAVIVNPGIILSPVFWSQSSSRIFESCAEGNKYYTEGLAAYVAATDVSKIMITLMKKQQYANRYILVENNYTFKEILSTIQVNLGVAKPSIRVSARFLKWAYWIERCLSLVSRKEQKLSQALLNSAFNNQRFSNKKIKHTLSYEFKSALASIEEICRFYRLQKAQNHTSL